MGSAFAAAGAAAAAAVAAAAFVVAAAVVVAGIALAVSAMAQAVVAAVAELQMVVVVPVLLHFPEAAMSPLGTGLPLSAGPSTPAHTLHLTPTHVSTFL